VFFGLNGKTDKKQLAYAVLEGVVFSLYDIYLTLGQVRGSMIAGGGSVVNEMMTRLKAELFEKEIVCVEENDVSALGAAMLAMVGNGRFASLQESVEKIVRYKAPVQPTGELTEILKKRFGVYRNLYQSLKNNFSEFSQINFHE
jgi:xylulokinase